MSSLKTVIGPAAEPVSLAEAKAHLRVEIPDEDSYISGLIVAARIYCEQRLSRQFVTATLKASWDGFPDDCIRLPRNPVQSVTSIVYTDEAGDVQTLAPEDYVVDADSDPARITPAYGAWWPLTRSQIKSLSVTFVAGYGAAAAVPETIRLAIKFLVGHWYLNREAVTGGNLQPVPLGVDALLNIEWNGEL